MKDDKETKGFQEYWESLSQTEKDEYLRKINEVFCPTPTQRSVTDDDDPTGERHQMIGKEEWEHCHPTQRSVKDE